MAYPDSILRRVEKPARYTGSEWNAVVKPWGECDVRVVLSYPDTYEIGMSNLSVPILYDILNKLPGVLAERTYAPWVDMAALLRSERQPLLSLENGRPLSEFDIIGFSLGYELTYTNVLEMLDLADIPFLAAQRDGHWPLVVAGGSCAFNPEPLADFIDVFIVGDGEEAIVELSAMVRQANQDGIDKQTLLRRLAMIPGFYVPSLYQVDYNGDGTVASVTSTEAPAMVGRRIVDRLPPPPTHPVMPYIEVVQDRAAIEISRGCSRGCRFCHAGVTYRPVRLRPPEEIVRAAEDIINSCGYDELSLLSLSCSDYPGIAELVTDLAGRYRERHLTISLPSLRLTPESVGLVQRLAAGHRAGLTFAPEVATERMRAVINKTGSEEELMATARAAFEAGWTTLKLYFMVGLPTETEEDVAAIPALVSRVHGLGKVAAGRRPQLRVSLASFVPKAHTPFQWVAQDNAEILHAKHELVRQGLARRGINLSWQEPEISRLEAVLSRGDRRLGAVILSAWQKGARFDAWSEHFKPEVWRQAFAECGLEPAFYANRQRPTSEVLPWGHISAGVSDEFLLREYQRSLEGAPTPDCRVAGCQLCGLEENINCR